MGDRPASGRPPMQGRPGMPKKTENAAVETEQGFGTGLRVKLEGRKPEAPEAPAEPEPVDVPAPVAEAEPETVDEPELSETEQLWAELEESLAREEQLKRALAEQAHAYEDARELGRRLTERSEALEVRERQLAEQIRALEAASTDTSGAEPEHGRAYLRRRVEENGDTLWRVFQEALVATDPDGRPDFQLRLLAASTLLAEADGELAQMSPGERVAAARDELAGMRAKRAAKPKK
jgi:hypothetical protein